MSKNQANLKGHEINSIWIDEFTDVQDSFIQNFLGNWNVAPVPNNNMASNNPINPNFKYQSQPFTVKKGAKFHKDKRTLKQIIEDAVNEHREKNPFVEDVIIGQMLVPKLWGLYLFTMSKSELKAKKKFVRDWVSNLSDSQLQLCLTQLLKQDTLTRGEKRTFVLLLVEDKKRSRDKLCRL